MELVEYGNPTILLQDILSVIEENFISHYLLFETTDRIIHGEEDIYYGCTVKNERTIEITYLHTNRGHYFYGNTNSILAVNLLSCALKKEQFAKETILFGSVFIIDCFINEKKINLKKTRCRYYMSLKSFTLRRVNTVGDLLTANEKDYDFLAPLKIGFYREEFEGKGLQTDEKILSDFRKSLQSGDIYYWKVNNQITTLLSITKLPEHRIYIPYIYTLPDYRCKGISKLALGTLLNSLFNSDIIEIGLNVKVSNKAAFGLFSSLGMTKIYETGIYE